MALPLPQERSLHALNRVLDSVNAVRSGRAIFILLGSFSLAGLALAMAETALAREQNTVGAVEAALALFVAFYGGNAAGLVLMDEARGLAPREIGAAVRDALAGAHRLLLVLLAAGALGLALFGVLAGLLWLCRLPWVGPLLFGAVVPLGVLLLGGAMLAAAAVVAPLAAPAVWSGRRVGASLRFLARQVRHRLLLAALLSAAVSLLAAAVGALVSFAVFAGGRAVAALAVIIINVDLPPQQLMAGLFGYGLRSLGAAGAPVAQNAHGAAALVGGGLVFALALVLPGVVYLRGICAALLALEDADAEAAWT